MTSVVAPFYFAKFNNKGDKKMTDHNENKIIDEEDKDHPPEFEDFLPLL